MSKVFNPDFVERQGPLLDAERRIDVAAAYRLIGHYKLDDLIYSNASARTVEGGQLVTGPHGLWSHEVTASSLVAVDFDGRLVAAGSHAKLVPSRFGALLHSSFYLARPDVQAVIHLHTAAGVAVSMLKCGLLTTNHTGMHFHGAVAYHDYEGDFVRLDERERLAASLGANHVMILRNHGLITVGDSMAAAFNRMYYLEFLCRAQLSAMATGQELVTPPEATIQDMVRTYNSRPTPVSGYEWPAFLRLLDGLDPSYRD